MSFEFGEKSKKLMIGVDMRLIEIAEHALSISLIDFGIPNSGGVRLVIEQQELFALGVSKADGVNRRSRHQDGLALDVFAYVDGKASWKKAELAMIAAAMLQSASNLGHSLYWGGLWKSKKDSLYGWDMGHFELRDE